MTWEQMASLHQMGFEVANHTIAHRSVTRETPEEFAQDLEALEVKASTFGIPKMVSFAYPSYGYTDAAIAVTQTTRVSIRARGPRSSLILESIAGMSSRASPRRPPTVK